MPPPNCQRCGKQTHVTIVSRFNTQAICVPCEREEKAHPDYEAARAREEAEVRKGNYNFEGVGLPPDLERKYAKR